ncbi:MAG: photosynthetic complex putative assembly protein PuhB [Pseudomonadota bacterium]
MDGPHSLSPLSGVATGGAAAGRVAQSVVAEDGFSPGTVRSSGGRAVRDADEAELAPHGLPAALPAGEWVVWQGAPRWLPLARQVFHIGWIGAYFALLAAWALGSAVFAPAAEGGVLASLLASLTGIGVSAALVIGLLALLAWLSMRTTVYTITNRRIVMRIGIALSKTIDIPFGVIDSVGLKTDRDGSGNLSIQLNENTGIAYLMVWPHTRPFKLKRPQPMLRAVPNVGAVAERLAERLRADAALRNAAAAAEDDRSLAAGAAGATGADGAAGADMVGSEEAPAGPREPVIAPRVPLFAAMGLVVFSLLAVAISSLATSTAPDPANAPTPYAVHSIDFKALGDFRYDVVTLDDGQSIAVVEPGRDGFLSNALRSFRRTRDLRSLPLDAPYQFIEWDTGRATLSDPTTDQHIQVDSFGPIRTGAMQALNSLRTIRPTGPAAGAPLPKSAVPS